MRFVLDTSVTFSALVFGGKPLQLLNALLESEWHEACASAAMFEELERKVREKSRDPEKALHQFNRYRSLATLVTPEPLETPICRDPNDDFILECALGADARVIVSSDADLLVLHGSPFMNKRSLLVLSVADAEAYGSSLLRPLRART